MSASTVPAAPHGEPHTPARPAPVGAAERFGPLVARILLSQIFLFSGVMKVVDWSGTEAQMAGRGMFWIPLFHVAALLVELGAGLSLLLGCKARLGAQQFQETRVASGIESEQQVVGERRARRSRRRVGHRRARPGLTSTEEEILQRGACVPEEVRHV